MSQTPPRIGVGAYIFHQGKMLFMQRLSPHGAGTWSPPGGHLEHGEDWLQCAAREAQEELGVTLLRPRLLGVTNDLYPATDTASAKHYVTLHVEALAGSPHFTINEPHKISQALWAPYNAPPTPTLLSYANFLTLNLTPTYSTPNRLVLAA